MILFAGLPPDVPPAGPRARHHRPRGRPSESTAASPATLAMTLRQEQLQPLRREGRAHGVKD